MKKNVVFYEGDRLNATVTVNKKTKVVNAVVYSESPPDRRKKAEVICEGGSRKIWVRIEKGVRNPGIHLLDINRLSIAPGEEDEEKPALLPHVDISEQFLDELREYFVHCSPDEGQTLTHIAQTCKLWHEINQSRADAHPSRSWTHLIDFSNPYILSEGLEQLVSQCRLTLNEETREYSLRAGLMHGGDLFAGSGSFTLAMDETDCIKTTLFVEKDPSAKKVLSSHWQGIPVLDDIRRMSCGLGDYRIFTAGSPCQNFSKAGDRSGLSGAQSSLFWELLRVTAEARPNFVVWENVRGSIHTGMRTVLAAFRMIGYQIHDVLLLSAIEFGSQCERQRVFVIAVSQEWADTFGMRSWDNLPADILSIRRASQWLSIFRDGSASHPACDGKFPLLVRNRVRGRIKARQIAGNAVPPAIAKCLVNRVVEISGHGTRTVSPTTRLTPHLVKWEDFRDECIADVDRLLPLEDWTEIKARLVKSLESRLLDVEHPEFKLLTLTSGSKGSDAVGGKKSYRPSGQVGLVGYLKRKKIIRPGTQLSASAFAGLMGFPLNYFHCLYEFGVEQDHLPKENVKAKATEVKKRGDGKFKSGWLNLYVKRDKNTGATFPPVDGERDPKNPKHNYCAYKYKVKDDDLVLRTQTLSIPSDLYYPIKSAIAKRVPYQEIIQMILRYRATGSILYD